MSILLEPVNFGGQTQVIIFCMVMQNPELKQNEPGHSLKKSNYFLNTLKKLE